jgi:hypothetical protein
MVGGGSHWFGSFPVPPDVVVGRNDRLWFVTAGGRSRTRWAVAVRDGVVHFNGQGRLA